MATDAKNTIVTTVMGHLLDGNKGSNLLGAVLTAVMANNIDYPKAVAGFRLDSMENATESAKLTGTVLAGVFAWFVGKKKKPEGHAS